MSSEFKYCCDLCKKEIKRTNPNIEVDVFESWIDRYIGKKSHYDLCSRCAEKMIVYLTKEVIKDGKTK